MTNSQDNESVLTSPAKVWALSQHCAEALNSMQKWRDPAREPSCLVQRFTGNLTLCGSPTEYFSHEMPIFRPNRPEEEKLLPIDILYGCYDPLTRSINIYVERICQDAEKFGAEYEEFLQIIRIHEYAHAVVHLGNEDKTDLYVFGANNRTDWQAFLKRRTNVFHALSHKDHEFLAQAITYGILCKMSEISSTLSTKFRQIFEALEKRQPSSYQISDEVKRHAANANWPVIINKARQWNSSNETLDFSLSDALDAFICTKCG